jgi:hypothetical protein
MMAKNLTNVHGKLDRILERLSKLDTQTMTYQRRSDNQLRLIAQLVGEVSRMANDTAQAVARIAEIQGDIALMANEARKEAKEAKERVIELSAGSRRH